MDDRPYGRERGPYDQRTPCRPVDHGSIPGPDEGADDARPKRPSRRPLFFVLALLGVLGIVALTRYSGDPATIDATGIGPIEVGESSRKAMQNWAVGPVTFWFVGDTDPPPPVRFRDELWQYECVDREIVFGVRCRTLFGLDDGIVVTVMTSNTLFSTPAGTRIGRTPLAEAIENERGKWSGWSVECPRIELPARAGVTFLARVSRNAERPDGFVSGFYLSVKPASFAFCG